MLFELILWRFCLLFGVLYRRFEMRVFEYIALEVGFRLARCYFRFYCTQSKMKMFALKLPFFQIENDRMRKVMEVPEVPEADRLPGVAPAFKIAPAVTGKVFGRRFGYEPPVP